MKHLPSSNQSSSGLKQLAAIAVALVLLTAANSCRKITDVTTKTEQAGTRNNARMLDGNDSAEIVTNIVDFFDYADERAHGQSGSPGGLSSTLSVEAAKDLMANTLNYYYGVMGDDLEHSQWYTDSVTIPLNGSSTIDLSDVADGYNDALTQIKSDYVAVGNVTAKRLEFAYFEVEGTGSNRTFIFKYHIGWDPVNPQAWTTASINVPFGSAEGNLYWEDAGSSCHSGTDGAPYYMERNIKNYFNRFYGMYVVTTRDRIIPVNPTIDVIFGASAGSSNPFAAANPSVLSDYWSHYIAVGTTSQLNGVSCIPTNGLNAYRSAIISYIQGRETTLNKWFTSIDLLGVHGGPSTPSHKWRGTYTFSVYISGEMLHSLE